MTGNIAKGVRDGIGNQTVTDTVTIANGTTTSPAVDLGSGTLMHLITPAALTGTAITFQVSVDGTTFVALNDDAGAAVSLTVAANKCVSTGAKRIHLTGIRYLKLVSGSTEAADRVITLAVKMF